MIETGGLYHVHLLVADMARAVAFYGEAFGYREVDRVGDDMVFLGLPGRHDIVTLRLADDDDERGAVGRSAGIGHFGFRLPEGADVDAAAAQIERAGGRVERRGEHAPGVPFVYFRDPDGYLVELS